MRAVLVPSWLGLVLLLALLLEICGVDMVFSGHVHNYQRSVPLRFTPNPPKRLPGGYVNGDFQLDRTFDGETRTQPNGIIHIVTGGGGGPLYGGDLKKNAVYFQTNAPGNWAPFTTKLVADRHSFVVVDLNSNQFQPRAIDLKGAEFDRILITKPGPVPSPSLTSFRMQLRSDAARATRG